MDTLTLEGENLGQKHQNYNKLLKEIVSTNKQRDIEKIDYNEPDINSLFKIDIASKKQDVSYILEVLKCEDMLYVSRALKQSVWLITDTKYAHIINPDYLYTQLLPQMTSKAGNKFILTIRLTLKDEKRVERFFQYYEDKKELRTAVKWLHNCSISYIENAVKRHITYIPNNLIKRLCEKSITILEIYCQIKNPFTLGNMLSETKFLLIHDADKFISIINSYPSYTIPNFNRKSTQLIMKIRPDIILDNFDKFATKIHIPTFVQFLKKEDIKYFLLKHLKNDNLKFWFTFENMKHFVLRMPSESQFDFVKRICIEKTQDNEEMTLCNAEMDLASACCAVESVPHSSNANIYRWYRFAPFSVAFTDLKKLIRVESNPTERNEIFAVLMYCARRNSQNVHAVLQYYRDRHINEPFKFKIHFVNTVLTQSNSHRFDDETWTILNDIFCSMEVYSENENNIQSCLKYIILYKVVHDTEVPDIIADKFEFDTFKSFQSKLNDEEKHKVFDYLHQFIITKIQNIKINNESDLSIGIEHIMSGLNLLNDWNKDLLNYSIILEKIREISNIKDNKSWSEDLSKIYNVNKSWRKHMFNESLILRPTQETCLNALKHNPEILELCKENICLNDAIILTRLLNKLRVYWPHTLAKAFEDTFRSQLENKTKHKISVRGLCILLPKKQLADLISKYKPHDTKINWAETDNFNLSIQKCLGKYMPLARPHPPVDIILTYAKGDYLQFVIPSLNSILFNLSSEESVKHIPALLAAPVSLQKHGLRAAFVKLKTDDFLTICKNTWILYRNPSIRANVFKLVFELLCKENDENKIREIWHVLETFIDKLTSDENRIIHVTLSQTKKVPVSVKLAYCIKSYRYLKSLPLKTNCDKFLDFIVSSTLDLMEFIDIDFIVEVIFNSFDQKFVKQYYNSENVISACLLSTKSEAIQTQRYEKIFVPLLKKYLAFINDMGNEKLHPYIKNNFNTVLKRLLFNINYVTINKNMITPIKLFSNIHNDLVTNFSREGYFVLLMTWNLVVKYMYIIEKYRFKSPDMLSEDQSDSDSTKGNIIYLESASEFGKVCMEQLKEEIQRYFPSIYRFFAKVLCEIFRQFRFEDKIILATLKSIQDHADVIEGHLLIIELLPDYLIDDKDKEARRKICQVLGSHSSAEVRMHYLQHLREIEPYF